MNVHNTFDYWVTIQVIYPKLQNFCGIQFPKCGDLLILFCFMSSEMDCWLHKTTSLKMLTLTLGKRDGHFLVFWFWIEGTICCPLKRFVQRLKSAYFNRWVSRTVIFLNLNAKYLLFIQYKDYCGYRNSFNFIFVKGICSNNVDVMW